MTPSRTPTDRESGPDRFVFSSPDVFTIDHRSLQARKKGKPRVTCFRLSLMLIGLAILSICGFIAYAIFLAAKLFWHQLINPHRAAIASAASTSHLVIQSYYGSRVPKFDVVASVFIRLGGDLPRRKAGGSPLLIPFRNETQQFGHWHLLYSQRVFSQIDFNLTEEILHKTVDLPIPWDILSRFYEPQTYFPQIVNTFVVVPSNPDPIYEPSSSGHLTPFNLVDFAYPDPTLTPWSQSPLHKLSRPLGPSHDDKHTPRLDAFYDATAVREFALRPVRNQWTSFDPISSPSQGSNHTLELQLGDTNTEILEEREGLRVKRNATLKIKTRSHLSIAKMNPDYDLFDYMSGRDAAAKCDQILYSDPLNRASPPIVRRRFKDLGHYQAHVVHSPESVEIGSFFYGPYLTLHSHAAGGQDWFTLPRINESSNHQSEDPLIVPWHITFDLLSNTKLGVIDLLDWPDDQTLDDHKPVAAAYVEAETLEHADIRNSLLANNPTSSQRSILRIFFFLIGDLIESAVAGLYQIHYLYTRLTSTGISIHSAMLNLSSRIIIFFLQTVLPPLNHEEFSVFDKIFQIAISMIALVPQVNLWLGIEFTWADWSSIPVPIGLKRFRIDHRERMSRRVDQQFSWIQRSLTVLIISVFLIYSPQLPHHNSSSIHNFSTPLRPSLSSLRSKGLSLYEMLGATLEICGTPFLDSIALMSSLSQVLLNMRLGLFGGSYPIFAWTQVIGAIISWAPVVFGSKFGTFETTGPLHISVPLMFAVSVVLLWQAITLPGVKQDEEPDE